MSQSIPEPALRLIRLALLGGVVLFGLVIFYLTRSEAFDPNTESAGVLQLAFLVLAVSTFAGILAVRAVQARAEPARRGTLVIVGWALGEGVALFGGVAWLIAGLPLLYVTGLGLMVVAFLLVPIPADS